MEEEEENFEPFSKDDFQIASFEITTDHYPFLIVNAYGTNSYQISISSFHFEEVKSIELYWTNGPNNFVVNLNNKKLFYFAYRELGAKFRMELETAASNLRCNGGLPTNKNEKEITPLLSFFEKRYVEIKSIKKL